jgi:sodium pump decarboxylase gamma subunit
MGSIGIGLQLTIYGMGLVFLLLAVMALLIKLLLKFDSAQVETAGMEELPASDATGFDADQMAAIIVAVTAHRTTRRKEAAPAMREHMPGTIPSRWVTGGRSLQNTSWQPGRRTI